MEKELFTLLLKKKALELGFDACGIAPAAPLSEESIYLRQWLSQNYNARMKYMECRLEKRENPSELVENAASLIVVLMSYNPPQKQSPECPQIAYYAYGNDYHDVMRDKLNTLLLFLQKHYPAAKGRVFVDAAPVMEKAWAVRAGLGWIGKNTLLINPELGSFTFIAELIVDIALTYDRPETRNLCADCTKCMDACSAKSITKPFTLDANKCIAYHTIENKEPADRTTFGYLFGCDDCQKVCPWNKKAATHRHPELMPLPEIMHYTADDYLTLNDATFHAVFSKSPLKRAGLEKLKATVHKIKMCGCIANS
jgi:epoxyqueuosine reductase